MLLNHTGHAELSRNLTGLSTTHKDQVLADWLLLANKISLLSRRGLVGPEEMECPIFYSGAILLTYAPNNYDVQICPGSTTGSDGVGTRGAGLLITGLEWTGILNLPQTSRL